MLFARGAVCVSQILERREGTGVKRTALEGCILLPAQFVCCCDFDEQHHIMIIRLGVECVIKMSYAQGISGGTVVLSRGLVVLLRDYLQNLGEAAQKLCTADPVTIA